MFYKQDKPDIQFYKQENAPKWDLFWKHSDNPEHKLFQSVTTEFNDVSGFPILYWIKKTGKEDYLYGEDPNAEFYGPYETKFIYKPTDEKALLDVFGIRGDDLIEGCFMAHTVYTRDVYNKFKEEHYEEDIDIEIRDKPKVGDIVKVLWNEMLYEIVDVGEEDKIFQANKQVYDLILRNYRYSEEDYDDMLNKEVDFPNIIDDREDRELEEYGENTEAGEESKENYDYTGKNTRRVYGYDSLD